MFRAVGLGQLARDSIADGVVFGNGFSLGPLENGDQVVDPVHLGFSVRVRASVQDGKVKGSGPRVFETIRVLRIRPRGFGQVGRLPFRGQQQGVGVRIGGAVLEHHPAGGVGEGQRSGQLSVAVVGIGIEGRVLPVNVDPQPVAPDGIGGAAVIDICKLARGVLLRQGDAGARFHPLRGGAVVRAHHDPVDDVADQSGIIGDVQSVGVRVGGAAGDAPFEPVLQAELQLLEVTHIQGDLRAGGGDG